MLVPALSEHNVFLFLLQFAVLLAAARALGTLARRFGQPSVLGELLAGILLGPAVLGQLLPGLHGALFPADQTQEHMLEMLSWIGMVLLILRTGLEVDARLWRGLGRAALFASLLGMMVPYASGFGLARWLPSSLLPPGRDRVVIALFLATAMSISAVKVIAKTLLDLKLTRRDVGAVILAASITDDTFGWVLLSIVSSIAVSGHVNVVTVMKPVAATVCVLAGAVAIGRPLVRKTIGWLERTGAVEYGTTSGIFVLTLALASLTQRLGIHAVFGAFIAGVLITSSPRVRQATLDELDAVIFGVFAPIFFVYTGLRVTTLKLPPAGITLLILGIAIIGKVVGSGLGARLGGMRWLPSLAVGIGMSARGSMELVVARIGMDLGVLSPSLYAAIVLIPMVTSLVTPVLLRAVTSRIRPEAAEAARLGDDETRQKAIIKREGTRMLAALSGGPRSLQAMKLAAALARLPGATLVGMSVVPDKKSARRLQRRAPLSEEQTRTLFDQFAAEQNLPDFHSRIVAAPSPAASIEQELAKHDYDLIFVGAGRRRMVANRLVSGAVEEGGTSAVVLSGESFPQQYRRIVVASDGGHAGRGAAELALLWAHALGAEISAIHIAAPLRDPAARGRAEDVGLRVVGEIAKIGEQQDGIRVDAQVRWSGSPGRAIVETARELGADLLVMGAVPQVLGRRTFLGNTVEHVLGAAHCPVALFVPAVPRATARAA